MKRHSNSHSGFSLVELTLALGIGGFCLMALLSLLPLGMETNRIASSQTAAASIISSIVADLRSIPPSSLTSSQYNITLGTAKVLYIDDEGRPVSLTDPNAAPRYRIAITFPPNPVGPFGSTFVSLRISWPALGDPAATATGKLETFFAVNRY